MNEKSLKQQSDKMVEELNASDAAKRRRFAQETGASMTALDAVFGFKGKRSKETENMTDYELSAAAGFMRVRDRAMTILGPVGKALSKQIWVDLFKFRVDDAVAKTFTAVKGAFTKTDTKTIDLTKIEIDQLRSKASLGRIDLDLQAAKLEIQTKYLEQERELYRLGYSQDSTAQQRADADRLLKSLESAKNAELQMARRAAFEKFKSPLANVDISGSIAAMAAANAYDRRQADAFNKIFPASSPETSAADKAAAAQDKNTAQLSTLVELFKGFLASLGSGELKVVKIKR